MAGITIGGKTEDKKFSTKVPAAEGYSYTVGAVPNKALVNQGVSAKQERETPKTEPTTSANTGTKAGNTAGDTKVTVSLLKRDTTPVSAPVASVPAGPTAQQQAETSLAKLREDYAKQLRDQYDYSAQKMKAERDDALRENWVLQQQAEAALPEQLAARGINGGATETRLADLRAQYQGNRNDIRSGYMDEMGDLSQNYNQVQAEGQRSYNERWLDYLLTLAQMDEQYKKDAALKMLKT